MNDQPPDLNAQVNSVSLPPSLAAAAAVSAGEMSVVPFESDEQQQQPVTEKRKKHQPPGRPKRCKLSFQEDPSLRESSYHARVNTLLKNAADLHKITGCDFMFVCFSEKNKTSRFLGSPKLSSFWEDAVVKNRLHQHMNDLVVPEVGETAVALPKPKRQSKRGRRRALLADILRQDKYLGPKPGYHDPSAMPEWWPEDVKFRSPSYMSVEEVEKILAVVLPGGGPPDDEGGPSTASTTMNSGLMDPINASAVLTSLANFPGLGMSASAHAAAPPPVNSHPSTTTPGVVAPPSGQGLEQRLNLVQMQLHHVTQLLMDHRQLPTPSTTTSQAHSAGVSRQVGQALPAIASNINGIAGLNHLQTFINTQATAAAAAAAAAHTTHAASDPTTTTTSSTAAGSGGGGGGGGVARGGGGGGGGLHRSSSGGVGGGGGGSGGGNGGGLGLHTGPTSTGQLHTHPCFTKQ